MRGDSVNISDQDTFIIVAYFDIFIQKSYISISHFVYYDIVVVSSWCHNKQVPNSSGMSPNPFIDFFTYWSADQL